MKDKDMTIQEMVDCLGQIFEQAWRDRSKEYDVVGRSLQYMDTASLGFQY